MIYPYIQPSGQCIGQEIRDGMMNAGLTGVTQQQKLNKEKHNTDYDELSVRCTTDTEWTQE